MKRKIKFWLHGCDDSTPIIMDVTDDEYKFLEKIVQLSMESSTYGCMPVAEIEEIKTDE